ncbi:unnamed protein product [Trichobilharzia szidati]|nr:unnamed protein product [Trichobilharzia szidati]
MGEVNYPAKCQSFSRDFNWVDHKPEWYVNGPTVVEDHMDLQECNALSRAKELEDYLKSLLLHNNKKECRKQGERPLNIRTLREIEAKLEAKPSEPSERGDMSAFYKLLGFFDRISKSNNVTSQDKGKQHPDLNIDHSDFTDDKVNISDEAKHNISQPKLINSDTRNSDAEVLSIPNESSFVSINRTPKLEVSDITKHVTCNPVTAPYQRQFIASGPLGQNALRWFKAMTNAASANVCINHNLESFKTLHTKPTTTANASTNTQVPNTPPSEISISCSLPAYQNLLINEQTKLPGIII